MSSHCGVCALPCCLLQQTILNHLMAQEDIPRIRVQEKVGNLADLEFVVWSWLVSLWSHMEAGLHERVLLRGGRRTSDNDVGLLQKANAARGNRSVFDWVHSQSPSDDYAIFTDVPPCDLVDVEAGGGAFGVELDLKALQQRIFSFLYLFHQQTQSLEL